MAGKFGKYGFKALFVSCADHESTNEDCRGRSRDDKPVFIEEIQAGNQKVRPKYFKTVQFSIGFIQ